MSKSWKKILVTGASLLMMASVGAGVGNIAHADVPSYTGAARTTKRLTARRVLYDDNGYHLGMKARLPKGSPVRVVGTLNAEDYNIDIPGRMGTYELNGFDVTHASYRHHRRSHKSSFSAWFQLEHLFNRYGTRRHGHSAMIGGRRFTLATNISGAIENGHHISNDSSALYAMKYAINHPVRKHSVKRTRKHYRKPVVKHHRKSTVKRQHGNKRSAMFKRYLRISKHSHSKGIVMPTSSDTSNPIPNSVAKKYIKNSRYAGVGANTLKYASKRMTKLFQPKLLKSFTHFPKNNSMSKAYRGKAEYKLSQYNTIEAEIKTNLQEQGY